MQTKSKTIRQAISLDVAINQATGEWLDEGYLVCSIEANWQLRFVYESDDLYQYQDVLVVATVRKL